MDPMDDSVKVHSKASKERCHLVSWVAAPSTGQNASPWLIQVLSELGRQR
jgi:hypothetical protein